MNLLSIFRNAVDGVAGSCTGGPATLGFGVASFSSEARQAIEAAHILPRDPDEDGPRIFVRSLAFHGSFRYSREEAASRIQCAFPELSESGIHRAVAQLESRVRAYTSPKADPARPNWVHGWKN